MVDASENPEGLEKGGDDAKNFPQSDTPPKRKKEITVVSLPHDNDIMEQEMAELFDEDRVTHQHGGSEPEKD